MSNGTDSNSGRFRLGTHDADIKNLKEQFAIHKRDTDLHLTEQDEKLDAILATLNRAKGSWKTLVFLGTLAVGLSEGLHQFIVWIRHP